MANLKDKDNKDQYLKDFVLEQKKLNDIKHTISEFSDREDLSEVKQYILDNIQVAFAKHLPLFRKAFAIGKDFAKKVTNDSNS
jgi:hypothetical protein